MSELLSRLENINKHISLIETKYGYSAADPETNTTLHEVRSALFDRRRELLEKIKVESKFKV